MKIKLKLSIIMVAIVAVIVTGIAVLLLREAGRITLNSSIGSLTHMLEREVNFWKGREDANIRVLYTLGAVMEDYESIPVGARRDQFDSMLRGVLADNESWVLAYSIWKPNALDGMDAQYIGRPGSSPEGQYAMTVTKETGSITVRASTDIHETMARLNGPLARKDRFDNPVHRIVNGKDTFVIIVQVPIINQRTDEVVGAVGCLLNVAVIQPVLEKIIQTNEEVAMMVMYSSNGFILGHFIPERIGKMMPDVDVELGDSIPAALKAIQEGTDFFDTKFDPTLNTNLELAMKSFKIGNSDQTWSIIIGATEAYVLKDINAITKFTIILAVIAVLAAAVVVYLVLHYVTRPIVMVADTLKDISEGEGDLTRSIAVHSNDEVGRMALYFNKTLEKIKNLVINIKGEASELSDIGVELAGNMNETAAAINQITANIQSIKGRIINQSASVTETNATMEQITVNIDKLNGHVEHQTSTISESSSAIEQMIANVQSVTQTLFKNSENVTELTEASEAGHTGLQEVAADIQEISRESEGLLQINSVMQNIASQTNLLSMNAAIEAAHAGDAGKGFAVVADEIRKLAENSSVQSKTISTVLKKIKSSIDKITQSTGDVLQKFEAIDSSVRIVAEQEERIRNVMDEQGQGSKQILEAVGYVNHITQQVKGGSSEMLEGSSEVIRESKNLEKATQEITGGINEMASGADQINIAVHRVNELSGKNREGIDSLIKEVSRFKVA
jgi:methyl-accepting chemotaxis protein